MVTLHLGYTTNSWLSGHGFKHKSVFWCVKELYSRQLKLFLIVGNKQFIILKKSLVSVPTLIPALIYKKNWNFDDNLTELAFYDHSPKCVWLLSDLRRRRRHGSQLFKFIIHHFVASFFRSNFKTTGEGVIVELWMFTLAITLWIFFETIKLF